VPTVYFEDLEVGSVHLGRECICDKAEMLEFSRRNDRLIFPSAIGND
jgi:hypothetical protein